MKPDIKERLSSLDILRGFDMFWIVGGGALVIALAEATGWGWLQVVAGQMHHKAWVGFHFEDLIFPLFMFISGVAIPYSISSKLEKGVQRRSLMKRIIKRGVILILLGIMYNGTLEGSLADIRYASVLGQIGVGYSAAAMIFLFSKSLKWRLAWTLVILLLITTLQLFVPVPGHGFGQFTGEGVINAWIDQMFLPGIFYCGTFDPEGILCMVSAISLTLMGALAGEILRDGKPASMKKAYTLILLGVGLVVISLVLSPVYPIIKTVWTATYNILTAGISFMLLGIFYLLIDVKQWCRGIASYIGFFFKVIGMNSIFIYLLNRIVDFTSISRFFLGWLEPLLGNWILILGMIVTEWLILLFLYKKKIFLRI